MTPHERFTWLAERTAALIPQIAHGRPVTAAIVGAAAASADFEFTVLFGTGWDRESPAASPGPEAQGGRHGAEG